MRNDHLIISEHINNRTTTTSIQQPKKEKKNNKTSSYHNNYTYTINTRTLLIYFVIIRIMKKQ